MINAYSRVLNQLGVKFDIYDLDWETFSLDKEYIIVFRNEPTESIKRVGESLPSLLFTRIKKEIENAKN